MMWVGNSQNSLAARDNCGNDNGGWSVVVGFEYWIPAFAGMTLGGFRDAAAQAPLREYAERWHPVLKDSMDKQRVAHPFGCVKG